MGNTNRLDYIAIKNRAATLENKYAVVLDLIYFEGCTYKQVAKLLKLPLGTVKTRGRMALTLLKKRI
jgi:RNA polymerase sigma-70 factor (ECF subfamily)